jgi:glycosyltransferase involved in cell wall biosynthesis
LFQEISKRITIFVIFTGANEAERNKDFYKGDLSFPHFFLSKDFKSQKKEVGVFLRSAYYTEIIFGGWDTKIAWWMVFHLPSARNSCIFESSIYDSEASGFKGIVKRLFLSRISKAYPSGVLQTELLHKLNFKGKIIPYGGCGILNYQPKTYFGPKDSVSKFIFVGRLVEVKNLRLLVEVFNELPQFQLTIVGFGRQEYELKSLANKNIIFLGAIDNEKLTDVYKTSDVFILPSIKEPWGLVVEEALNNGLPVIVSNRVGCRKDLVNDDHGIVFEFNDKESLKNAIFRMTVLDVYNKYRDNISKIDFIDRALKQVNTFCC